MDKFLTKKYIFKVNSDNQLLFDLMSSHFSPAWFTTNSILGDGVSCMVIVRALGHRCTKKCDTLSYTSLGRYFECDA